MTAVAWSSAVEFQLVSGDREGGLRLWDVRRAGCLHIFDQYDVTRRHDLESAFRDAEASQSELERGVKREVRPWWLGSAPCSARWGRAAPSAAHAPHVPPPPPPHRRRCLSRIVQTRRTTAAVTLWQRATGSLLLGQRVRGGGSGGGEGGSSEKRDRERKSIESRQGAATTARHVSACGGGVLQGERAARAGRPPHAQQP